MNGQIKFYKNEGAWGFVTSETNEDFFFHKNDWRGKTDPKKGESVTFETKKGKKGIQATEVKSI